MSGLCVCGHSQEEHWGRTHRGGCAACFRESQHGLLPYCRRFQPVEAAPARKPRVEITSERREEIARALRGLVGEHGALTDINRMLASLGLRRTSIEEVEALGFLVHVTRAVAGQVKAVRIFLR